MVAGNFDQDKVQTQLRYTGVLETTRIRRQGYSERIAFAEFMKRYQVLAYPLHKKVPGDAATCGKILTKSKLENWLLGRTKVFLKYYHVEELARLLELHRRKVVTVQTVVRGWLIRRRYAVLRRERQQAAIVIQKHSRGYLARKRFQQELKKARKEKRVKSAIRIQTVVRGYLARRRYLRMRRLKHKNATTIQAAYRGYRVRRHMTAIRRRQKRAKEKQRAKVRAAVQIQSNYRGYKDRKDVSKIKSMAAKMETKTIYFLQQVEDSSDVLLRAQKGHKSVDLKKGAIVIKEGRRKDPEEFWSNSRVGRLTSDDEEALASQQETQMIFFIQQVNSSWNNLLEHTKSQRHYNSEPPPSPPTPPRPLKVQVLPKGPPQSERHHDRAPASDVPRGPQQRGFEVRPRELVLAEMHSKDSLRSTRSYRKEIWSAGDETYFKHFADEKLKKESKDQERRARNMLSIVVGKPSQDTIGRTESSPKETAKPTPVVAKARNFFENQAKPPEQKPVVRRTRSNEWKPKPAPQESPKTPAPPPVLQEKPVHENPKPKEPRNQADLVRLALAQQERQRSASEPAQELPRIPPPDYKLPPEKLGYLRHVTPGPKQVMPDNFHVENIHLRHAYRPSSSHSEVPRYAHLLRKTGRRGELGIQDDEESDVTRVCFNVPLVGVT